LDWLTAVPFVRWCHYKRGKIHPFQL